MNTVLRIRRRGEILLLFVTLSLGCMRGSTQPESVEADEKPPVKQTQANRLAKETSPYLLLHAHNPVDWYPWGDEALNKAKKEDKLIFLSVGYSSCHWCHVMERESFMDKEIAAYMNAHFVCIKVDREERPDIDSIYMTAVQIISENGGWPMSVFMTPDAKPFFGATYFPARDNDRPGAMGFFTLLKRVKDLWGTSRERLEDDAERVTALIKRQMDGGVELKSEAITDSVSDRVQADLAEQYDPKHGGFGYVEADVRRPKFPEPSNLQFLLHRANDSALEQDQRQAAQQMLVGTIDNMAMGGIRDHLGGGFHRYSVDRFWKIPHFEKMLYDNGQLASVYAEAYALTGSAGYRRVVEGILNFVLREMQDDKGAFYSALDAESEGHEGKFYVWDKQAIAELLTADEMKLFASVYGLDEAPNFDDDTYAILMAKTFADTSLALDLSDDELAARLSPMQAKLLASRSKRPRPLTDTKILTAWNGLMIRGFADAGRVLERKDYLQAAERAAQFLLRELRTDDGRLQRTFSQGEARLNAYLDDYAFLIDGLIGLHQATTEERWLREADTLMQTLLELFGDEQRGGFFFTSNDHESLIARARNPVDGARPAGNSIAARNLIYLARELNKPEYLSVAERTIQSVHPLLLRSPSAAPVMATALDELLVEKRGASPQETAPR